MKISAEAALGLAWVLNERGSDVFLQAQPGSPWLAVDFPTRPDQYAIWQTTGAVYKVGSDGAVEEDPVYVPADFSAHLKRDRLMRMLERVTEERDELRRQLDTPISRRT